MHDALGDALVIEMEDLLAEMEVFEQGRTTGTDAQRVLVVSYRDTLLGREGGFFIRRGLMQLSALAPFLGFRPLPLVGPLEQRRGSDLTRFWPNVSRHQLSWPSVLSDFLCG